MGSLQSFRYSNCSKQATIPPSQIYVVYGICAQSVEYLFCIRKVIGPRLLNPAALRVKPPEKADFSCTCCVCYLLVPSNIAGHSQKKYHSVLMMLKVSGTFKVRHPNLQCELVATAIIVNTLLRRSVRRLGYAFSATFLLMYRDEVKNTQEEHRRLYCAPVARNVPFPLFYKILLYLFLKLGY